MGICLERSGHLEVMMPSEDSILIGNRTASIEPVMGAIEGFSEMLKSNSGEPFFEWLNTIRTVEGFPFANHDYGIIDRGTKLSLKRPAFKPVGQDIIFQGHRIDFQDVPALLHYILTNTNVEEGDCRLAFLIRMGVDPENIKLEARNFYGSWREDFLKSLPDRVNGILELPYQEAAIVLSVMSLSGMVGTAIATGFDRPGPTLLWFLGILALVFVGSLVYAFQDRRHALFAKTVPAGTSEFSEAFLIRAKFDAKLKDIQQLMLFELFEDMGFTFLSIGETSSKEFEAVVKAKATVFRHPWGYILPKSLSKGREGEEVHLGPGSVMPALLQAVKLATTFCSPKPFPKLDIYLYAIEGGSLRKAVLPKSSAPNPGESIRRYASLKAIGSAKFSIPPEVCFCSSRLLSNKSNEPLELLPFIFKLQISDFFESDRGHFVEKR